MRLPKPIATGVRFQSRALGSVYTAAQMKAYAAKALKSERKPATDEQVAEADENHAPSWLDYRDGWRDAERFHGIKKEDKA